MTLALIVIDLQHGMFSGALAPPMPGGEALLARVAAVIARARALGVPVLHVRHGGGAGHPLEVGSEGWQLHTDVAALPGETVIDKTLPDAFEGTPLLETLQDLGTVRVVIAGAQSEVCVTATTRSALTLGFAVSLVADGHGTWEDGDQTVAEIIARTNAALSELGAKLLGADELFRGLASG